MPNETTRASNRAANFAASAKATVGATATPSATEIKGRIRTNKKKAISGAVNSGGGSEASDF